MNYSSYEYMRSYKHIKDRITEGIYPDVKPVAYILGGQPGAGKTILQKLILKQNDNCIIINADTFRKSHPYFNEIQKKYADDSPKYTQPFINKVTEQLIEELSDQKYNIIIEGTLRTAIVPINTCLLLKNKGYTVELHILAVKKEISYESTILRYENAITEGKTPRATAKENHDNVVNCILDNLNTIYNADVFDKIKLISRFENCLYETGDTKNPLDIEDSMLNGKWNYAEIDMLKRIIFETKRLKANRKASDYDTYVTRTNKLLSKFSGIYCYFKVTASEAAYLSQNKISFEGKVAKNGESVIRVKAGEKDKAVQALDLFRNKRGGIKK